MGTTGGSVTGNTVNSSESFVNVNGGGGEFTISGNTFTSAEGADGYGIRENGTSTAVITLTDNSFTAASSIVLGKGNSVTAGSINVESGVYTGTISKTEAATGKIAISGGYFSEEFPQEYIAEDLVAQGKVCTPATDKPIASAILGKDMVGSSFSTSSSRSSLFMLLFMLLSCLYWSSSCCCPALATLASNAVINLNENSALPLPFASSSSCTMLMPRL